MSKLSFRARALDASKPMPIYMAEELPDLPDYSAINRAVPQMPSGMEKEEECEHHLQRAICAGLIIPTPEVSEIPDPQKHDKLYPANYKQPRQLIHMQLCISLAFTMEQDIPDYDMDSDDERWLDSQAKRIELTPLKFEEMMDRLEKSSGQTVVTLNEAKALLKEDDDLIIAVFDYWLNKRLKLIIPRKEKRQYKKRKHKSLGHNRVGSLGTGGLEGVAALSSDEEPLPQPSSEPEEVDDEGQFAFRRNKLCSYHMPKPLGNWPWCSKEENGLADKKYRYTLTTLSNPKRCIGFARRRMGRGGRVILDRLSPEQDDYWRTMDFTVFDSHKTNLTNHKILVKEEIDTNSFTFAGSNIYANSSNYNLKTPDRSVIAGYSDSLRTSIGDSFSESDFKCKQESADVQDDTFYAQEVKDYLHNTDDMVEFVRSVQRDWLHFRPKTPPPDYEPPCYMLPPEDPTFIPSANMPFSLELRLADNSSSSNILLDSSTFVTAPFLSDDFTLDLPEVPVTDTRQSNDTTNVQTGINLNVNVGLNTLNTNTNNTSSGSFIQSVNLNDSLSLSVDFCNDDEMTTHTPMLVEDVNDRTFVGCSKFTVTDINGSAGTSSNKYKQLLSHSSTLTSPKLNSVNVVSDFRQRSSVDCTAVSNANGLIAQFGMDVSPGVRTNNKLQPYAYSGEVGNSNTLSLHTSAHTVTLNSHSANIVEIPMSNDSDAVPNKSIAAQCETNTAPTNNKNKTIVRKNNLVMEEVVDTRQTLAMDKMMAVFDDFQQHLNTEQDIREEIRNIVREIEKHAREILTTLQVIHQEDGLQLIKTDQLKGFHLDLEDYLMGVLQLTTELSRFAINSVTNGDYDRPLQISRFVAEINAGFRVLNLKNDSLRKRFDVLKYDVKKIEEVVYDLTIRGLKNSQADAAQKPMEDN
ncbi:enhancer of polycomb [Holotrichia oblita]|uniref:Enhancer of polycomb n=1 Tax=Holotrichia oblita TaxID=644536 RepID=A0ACB9TLU8_HOLOL|nr:enhancer of polycomb [Holotrichia oblita]